MLVSYCLVDHSIYLVDLSNCERHHLASRAQRGHDSADAIVFLASQQAKHIYGAVLPVDGGRLAV
ncbi:hypothetical protein GCM10011399_21390 [Subtercola lobariae]|uniref:SDR family oxidoreductase n=1 Tax=Subtercola lobariae TaxID=1588641 RepID=A0A917B8P2_9MICO|nr:hypothetical protein GCM10011399_21390 [Subtercola lobariae]